MQKNIWGELKQITFRKFDMEHSFGFSNVSKPIVFKTGAEIKNSQEL